MELPPSSLPQQPILKKLKMSTTTTDDETADRKPKYKRRKVAIFFAYCCVGYQGMQKNPGAKTIEGDLEEALLQAGAVPEEDRGHPKRYDWARSARTDKGVSAVGQVVSGKFYVDPPGLVERLNSILPEQFKVFGYKRVTPSFSAKKFCDRRRYVYLLPVFALDPCAHRDRESVLASLGSGNELVKCLECPERGRKVEGVMGNKRHLEANHSSCVVNQDSKYNGCNLDSEPNGDDAPKSTDRNSNDHVEAIVSEKNPHEKVGNGRIKVSDENVVNANENGEEKDVNERSKFTYGEKEKERFNRILGSYVGTHSFYNFTTRIKEEDPSVYRYIVSFEANTVVTVDGMDFVKCEVVGQSFMLHQIRKMMGLAVAVMRNCAHESVLEYAFQKGVSITVPTAPEVGLYLDECYFTSYNNKWKVSHEELSMKVYAEEAEEFKMKHIYSHIAATEQKEGTVGVWLHSLNLRNYPDLRGATNKAVADTTSDAEKTVTFVDTALHVMQNHTSADTTSDTKLIETSADTTEEANEIGLVDITVSESKNIGVAADMISKPTNFEKIADAKGGDIYSDICVDMNSEIERTDA